MRRILVVNPNSSEATTRSIDRSLDVVRDSVAFEVACATLEEGPPGIETEAHIHGVIGPMVALMGRRAADAYVVACFSDPGLAPAREALSEPVIGIAESAMLMALGLGHRFGIIAIRDASVRRHLRYARSLGLGDRLAGDRAIGLGAVEAGGEGALARVVEVGRVLRDQDGADVLILGCAGMGHHRPAVEDALRLPVVDPSQAAVLRAAALLTLGCGRLA